MKIERLKDNPKICLNADSQVVVKETGNQTEVKYMINNTGGVIRKIDKELYMEHDKHILDIIVNFFDDN